MPSAVESPEVIKLRDDNAKLLQEISEITVTNQQLFHALKQKTTENVKVLTTQLQDLQKKFDDVNSENAALKKILEAYKYHEKLKDGPKDNENRNSQHEGDNLAGEKRPQSCDVPKAAAPEITASGESSTQASQQQSQSQTLSPTKRNRPPSRSAPSPPAENPAALHLSVDKTEARKSGGFDGKNSATTTTTAATNTTTTTSTDSEAPQQQAQESTAQPAQPQEAPPSASPPARPPPPVPTMPKANPNVGGRIQGRVPLSRSDNPLTPKGEQKNLTSMVKRARANMERSSYRRSQSLNGNEIRLLHEQEKRHNVVKEILSTERNYVKALGIVRERFQKVLEAKLLEEERRIGKAKQGVTLDHLKTIFLHIAVIHGYNTLLCRRLEERIDNADWGPASVLGDIFVDMGPHLRLYSSYIGNYTKAMEVLRTCKNDKKFSDFLEQIELGFVTDRKHPFYGYQLESFLITPVQRIPRYITLLKQLQKYTAEEHPDMKFIAEAIEKIEEVANENEKVQERSENIAVLFNLENRFSQSIQLVEPHRVFLYQGRAKIFGFTKEGAIKNPKAPKKCHLLLFNDILVLAKPKQISDSDTEDEEPDKEKEKEKEKEKAKKKHYSEEEQRLKFRYQLEVKDLELEDTVTCKDAPKSAFKLIHPEQSFCISLSASRKEKWLNELKQAITEVKKNVNPETK